MTLFERVKETAKKYNLNVKQTALKAGFGENSIYKWKNSTPSTEAVQKVADILNVSVDYLINGETKNPSAPQKIELEDAITKKDVFTYQGKEIPDDDWEIIKAIIERHRNKDGKSV